MASIRNLKKDIDYLTYEVVADCYTYMHMYPDKNRDKVMKIITDTVEVRNDLIARTNHPDAKDDKKKNKEYFKTIRKELFEKIDKAFQELSKLVK